MKIVVEGEMVGAMKHFLKVFGFLLAMQGPLWALREVRSVNAVKHYLTAGGEEWPTLVALLAYDSRNLAAADLKKIQRSFRRANGYRKYRDLVTFLSLNLADLDENSINRIADLSEASDLAKNAPMIVVFCNGHPVGQLTGNGLKREMVIEKFVREHFDQDMLQVRRRQEGEIDRAIKYEDGLSFYPGTNFGTPYYVRNFAWPFYAYYDYGFYFGW